MQQIMPNINTISGTSNFTDLRQQKALPPFSETIVKFLGQLSKTLFLEPGAKEFSDVMSFSFFCRPANLNILKRRYVDILDKSLGKGISFHIAPSNVPINFAYSLVMGLLAGNICIVKVSSKQFSEVDVVCSAITKLLNKEEFKSINNYISIVRYENDDNLNKFFTDLCDVRLIWGGDETVKKIRSAQLPVRASDITFADRISGCIINAQEYLKLDNKTRVAERFYNDTYLFDQNACSSPSIIYWYGAKNVIDEAKIMFWLNLQETIVNKQYIMQPIMASEKLMASCRAAIDLEDTKIIDLKTNLINRVELDSLPVNLDSWKQGGGFFFEISSKTIDELFKVMTAKFQTLSYIGFDGEELKDEILRSGVHGVDRIVECGDSMSFDPVWDGVDLIRQMSRIISYR